MSSKKEGNPQSLLGRPKAEKGKSSVKFDTSSSSSQQSRPQELFGRHNHDYGKAPTKYTSSSQASAQEAQGKSSGKKKKGK